MKNLLLVKSYSSVQVAHLYEHLFTRRVNDLFYKNSLFKMLDYALNGTTYDMGGIIIIDCELYNNRSIKYIDTIPQLHIDFGHDNENILTALQQIAAEEPTRLHATNLPAIIKALVGLDEQPWQQLDEFSTLDTKMIRRQRGPLYLSQQQRPNPRKLSVSLQLDTTYANNNRHIVALFSVLARFLLLTITNKVCDTFGTYHQDIIGKPSPASVTSHLLIIHPVAKTINVAEVKQTIDETAAYVLTPHTITRLVDDLASSNYLLKPSESPNFERILQETKLLIGAKGWQEIATVANVQSALRHTFVTVRFGAKQVQSYPFEL